MVNELHDALRRDTEKQIEDAKHIEAFTAWIVHRTTRRMQQVGEALRTHRPLASPLLQGERPGQTDLPGEPAWNAAKASGLLAFAPQEDIVTYTEVDSIVDHILLSYDADRGPAEKLRAFQQQVEFIEGPGVPAFSTATPAQLQTYLEELSEVNTAAVEIQYWARQLHGADTAILSDERNLAKIEAAERQFDALP